MLMPVMCPQCMLDAAAAVKDIPPSGIPIPTRVVPVQTVGLYRGTCSKGHPLLMVADFQQFELLFESAMEAFVDHYYRESVSSFASSLERFYEFSIQTMLLAQGVSKELMASMWKEVSNQSERQLGMFIGLHTAFLGNAPQLLPQKMVTFRNSIIHKGHFPSPQEVYNFGNSVYDLLNAGIKELRTKCPDAVEEARNIARQAAYSQLKEGENAPRFGMATTISLMVQDEPKPLSVAINKVAERIQRHRNESSGPPPHAQIDSAQSQSSTINASMSQSEKAIGPVGNESASD